MFIKHLPRQRPREKQEPREQQCEQTQTGMRDPFWVLMGEGPVKRRQKKTREREEDMGWVGRALMVH